MNREENINLFHFQFSCGGCCCCCRRRCCCCSYFTGLYDEWQPIFRFILLSTSTKDLSVSLNENERLFIVSSYGSLSHHTFSDVLSFSLSLSLSCCLFLLLSALHAYSFYSIIVIKYYYHPCVRLRAFQFRIYILSTSMLSHQTRETCASLARGI